MSTSPTPPSTNQPPTWPVTPPEPKRRGRTLFAAAIGLILLVATGCAATSGLTDPGPDPTPPTTPSPGPTDPPGDPAPRPDPPKEDPEPTPDPEDPASLVRDYFDAINARDYRTAWRLGGRNFSPSYEEFMRGFAETEHDTVTVLNVDGAVVTIRLVADERGGRQSIYQGTYTAEHGELVAADVRRVPGPPSTAPPPPTTTPAPTCDPSYPDVCLDPGVEDYDCAGGSGNGPQYVAGLIHVRPPDPFDLDRDGDGWGCDGG